MQYSYDVISINNNPDEKTCHLYSLDSINSCLAAFWQKTDIGQFSLTNKMQSKCTKSDNFLEISQTLMLPDYDCLAFPQSVQQSQTLQTQLGVF